MGTFLSEVLIRQRDRWKRSCNFLIGKGYEGMTIGDGGKASAEYVRVTYGEDVSNDDRTQVYSDLEAYCELDTKAMVDILYKLKVLI